MIKHAILLICLGFTLSTCSVIQDKKVLKCGHGLDRSHSVHLGMLYMAEQLEKKSGGKMSMEVYPSEQLGSERQCLELLQIGSLAMTKVSAAVLENFVPKIRALSIPYLFRDEAHIKKIQDGPIGREILESCEPFRFRGLTFMDSGKRSFYTKKPVRTPDDLAGLKIRVQESATAMSMVRNLGGSPTPLAFGELYTALQQGVVDGAENNAPSFYLTRHYEVCKYYTLDEHTAIPDMLLISTTVWNSLSSEEQQWVQEAADEAKVRQRELWKQSDQESLDAVKAAGVEIIIPDKKPFQEKVAPMVEALRDQPEVYNLVKKIQATES